MVVAGLLLTTPLAYIFEMKNLRLPAGPAPNLVWLALGAVTAPLFWLVMPAHLATSFPARDRGQLQTTEPGMTPRQILVRRGLVAGFPFIVVALLLCLGEV